MEPSRGLRGSGFFAAKADHGAAIGKGKRRTERGTRIPEGGGRKKRILPKRGGYGCGAGKAGVGARIEAAEAAAPALQLGGKNHAIPSYFFLREERKSLFD